MGVFDCDPGARCGDPETFPMPVNPGTEAYPGIPPVTFQEPYIAIECNSAVPTTIRLATSSTSVYRTSDRIANSRYYARWFTLTADAVGEYTFKVNSSSFVPYITVARNVNIRWSVAGSEIVVALTENRIGPLIIEVTTLTPTTEGSFELEVKCPKLCATGYIEEDIALSTATVEKSWKNDIRYAHRWTKFFTGDAIIFANAYRVTLATENDSYIPYIHLFQLNPMISVTINTATDVFTAVGHGLNNGDPVYVDGVSAAGGITFKERYFIINTSSDTFQLSATSGGSAVDVTTAGSGIYVQKLVEVEPKPFTTALSDKEFFFYIPESGTYLLEASMQFGPGVTSGDLIVNYGLFEKHSFTMAQGGQVSKDFDWGPQQVYEIIAFPRADQSDTHLTLRIEGPDAQVEQTNSPNFGMPGYGSLLGSHVLYSVWGIAEGVTTVIIRDWFSEPTTLHVDLFIRCLCFGGTELTPTSKGVSPFEGTFTWVDYGFPVTSLLWVREFGNTEGNPMVDTYIHDGSMPCYGIETKGIARSGKFMFSAFRTFYLSAVPVADSVKILDWETEVGFNFTGSCTANSLTSVFPQWDGLITRVSIACLWQSRTTLTSSTFGQKRWPDGYPILPASAFFQELPQITITPINAANGGPGWLMVIRYRTTSNVIQEMWRGKLLSNSITGVYERISQNATCFDRETLTVIDI
jgi:hypothetical protein